MKPSKFWVVFAFCSVLIASAGAQEWPAGPVTMVVPSSAGGAADIFGRIFAARLSELLGKPVIIENIGNGVTAVSRVAKAAPDGYHFGLGTAGTYAFSQSLYKNPLFNAVTDFAPVALIVEQPLLLVTRKDFPANNVREFAAYAKMNQANMRFGSGAGIGSSNHIVCELLNSAIGIKVTHVPYRDVGSATQDMIAGRIDYLCPLAAASIPLIQGDQIKGIAVLGKERLRNLPNLATAHEQGLTDFDGSTWFAFFLPKGTPEPIIRKLNAATIEAMNTSSVQQRLLTIAATVVAPDRRTPEYLKRFVVTEIDKWARPIKATGVSLD